MHKYGSLAIIENSMYLNYKTCILILSHFLNIMSLTSHFNLSYVICKAEGPCAGLCAMGRIKFSMCEQTYMENIKSPVIKVCMCVCL